MTNKIGISCIALGFLFIIASVGLIIYNYFEAKNAENTSKSMLQSVQETIIYSQYEEDVDDGKIEEEEAPFEIPLTQVNGYDCIGVISIPVLELELPVLTDWSYAKLKIAPCVYYGTYLEENFVIAAHNYKAHFGRFSELRQGDIILFTDVSGTVHCYEVVLIETLPGEATEQMITSGFDLSLYTCTQSGMGRVTVRCSRI